MQTCNLPHGGIHRHTLEIRGVNMLSRYDGLALCGVARVWPHSDLVCLCFRCRADHS